MKAIQIIEFETYDNYIEHDKKMRFKVGFLGRIKFLLLGYKSVFSIEQSKLI